MTIQQLWTPVKRELWEHKTGLLWTPATVALLLVLSILYVAATRDFSGGSINDLGSLHNLEFEGSDTHFNAGLNDHSEGASVAENINSDFMFFFIGLITFLLWLPLAIVLMVYAHSTLFDDRKNREILFWRSMPVSETQNVLTKFFVVGVVAPTLVFLLSLICLTVLFLANAVEVLVSSGRNFSEVPILFGLWSAVKIYGSILCNLILLLPFFSWMFFSSAVAKKSPFMVSSLVPLILVVLDKLANKFLAVDLHVIAAFDRYWTLLRSMGPGDDMVFSDDMILPFVIAMLAAGLLVSATIWLRNNRYEI